MVATRPSTRRDGCEQAQDDAAGGSGSGSSARGAKDSEERFHKGVAISMWQNSGDEHSNWTSFIRSKWPFAALPFGGRRYSGRYSVEESCPDTWNRCAQAAAGRSLSLSCFAITYRTPTLLVFGSIIRHKRSHLANMVTLLQAIKHKTWRQQQQQQQDWRTTPVPARITAAGMRRTWRLPSKQAAMLSGCQ
jgi:hypothetical protein